MAWSYLAIAKLCIMNLLMSFLKLLNKSFIFASLLLLSGAQLAHANNRLYRYDGNAPFVKMMLSMMSAMGILDRMPANGIYGRYGNAFSPWSTYSNVYGNPYSRALGWQGLSPGLSTGVVDNPFIRSPWIGSPWTQSALTGVSPLWGSPDWGVLPVDSYSYNRYAPYGSPWSVDDISGWVDEPWETSDWNPNASLAQSTNRVTAQETKPLAGNTQSSQLPQPIVPIVQNFNYNTPANAPPNRAGSANQSRDEHRNQSSSRRSSPQQRSPQRQSPQYSSPLAKLRYPGNDRSSLTRNPQFGNAQAPNVQGPGAQMRNRGSNPAAEPYSSQLNPDRQFSKKQHYEKPCITDFCGLKKPYLDGLWLAQDGEMLGIKNKRYLWSDGKKRYLTGRLKIENEYLVADVDGHERLMRFKYKLAGDHLLTMQPNGVVREFVRIPNNRRTPGYGEGYAPGQSAIQNYGAYYR